MKALRTRQLVRITKFITLGDWTGFPRFCFTCVMLTASALLYKCYFGRHVSARNAVLRDRAKTNWAGIAMIDLYLTLV